MTACATGRDDKRIIPDEVGKHVFCGFFFFFFFFFSQKYVLFFSFSFFLSNISATSVRQPSRHTHAAFSLAGTGKTGPAGEAESRKSRNRGSKESTRETSATMVQLTSVCFLPCSSSTRNVSNGSRHSVNREFVFAIGLLGDIFFSEEGEGAGGGRGGG